MNIPTSYTKNRYYKNNAKYFCELRELVIQYPRQCTRMILAKGRKREGANNWKLKYLYDWIIEMSAIFVKIPPSLIEKISWIMNDIIDYPKCPICGKRINILAKHCSLQCSGKDPNTLIKRIKTTQHTYGCDNVFQSQEIKQKISNKLYIEEGVKFTGQLKRKKKHTEETCLRKYGVKNVNQCPEIKQKGLDTVLSKHDHLYNYCKYEFDNRKFDSSWELMYYIYLKDHKIQFEYHKKGLFFVYKENGKQHRFYPDFVVNGEIQEIKGNQFFNDKGEPYNKQHKVWWWEKYNCIIKNGIKILREIDLKYVFEYYNKTYGKKSIQQFLIIRNKIKV